MDVITISDLKSLIQAKSLLLSWESMDNPYSMTIVIKFYFGYGELNYIVCDTFIGSVLCPNSKILDLVNKTGDSHRKFISDIIGYEAINNSFPNYRRYDGDAVYKILYTIYNLLPKKYINSKILIPRNFKYNTINS